ncbi:MAG: DUF222 domain-containing protein [Pseudomonadota bacterium]
MTTPSPTFRPYHPDDSELTALEAEMLSLAAHIAAATHRFLTLLLEFDRADGWHGDGMKSFAHWLNWRCGFGLNAAREKIRVAHALAELPRISEAFRHGRLSYSKVRALTRVATAANEDRLLELALSSTASQTERIVRGLKRCQSLGSANAVHRARRLDLFVDDDGSYVIRGRLDAETGALLVAALDSARGEPDEHDVDQDNGAAPEPDDRPAAGRADALGRLADAYLAGKAGSLPAGERHAVVIHVNPESLRRNIGDVSAETSNAAEPQAMTADGACLSRETARRLSCDASLLAVYENDAGEPLAIGRRSRAIPAAIRRALALRDGGCRFPGCSERRHVDAHHVQHWADGGETALDNLVTLCRYHHRCVHEDCFTVTMAAGRPRFFTPHGAELLPGGARSGEPRFRGNVFALTARNDPGIGPGSPLPQWWGEPLDLHAAVANVVARE